ncbi:MAG: anti-sigma factor antagonist [Coriobacteriia bacterium]|nr:anti-sigma factor antagonist [Coriobacteriia bacterium]
MTSFDIENEPNTHTCIARLSGDVDTAVVPELQAKLDASMGGGCVNVVLDLSDVIYADSSALGLLVWLDHRLSPVGGRLMLAGASPDVQRVLELSGLIGVAKSIGSSSSVAQALEGLRLPEKPTRALWEHEFEMHPDVNELAGMRERVSELIAPLGFQESALFDIKVAMGEALANAVRHGSSEPDDAMIEVGVFAYEDRVMIEVRDSGDGFDGTPSPSDDLYAPGGRGIMFMRALMDRVEFTESVTGGTCVRLIKHRGHNGV